MLSVNSNELLKGIVISFMFMDICNPSENSCFSKIFPVLLKCDFLFWFQPIIGRFYKMYGVFENLTFTTFLSPLLTRCYRFLTRCEYYLWLDSKYNVRRCDVLVQRIKQSQSKSFRTWSNISLKMAILEPLVNSCDTRARSLHYRFYRFNLVWPPCVLLMIYVKY